MTKEGSATIPEPQSSHLHENKAMGKGKLNNTKHRINVPVYPQNHPSCISEKEMIMQMKIRVRYMTINRSRDSDSMDLPLLVHQQSPDE